MGSATRDSVATGPQVLQDRNQRGGEHRRRAKRQAAGTSAFTQGADDTFDGAGAAMMKRTMASEVGPGTHKAKGNREYI